MEFNGKTVVITGGSSGMGFIAGKSYAKEGANVVLLAREQKKLDKCVADIKAEGGNVIGVSTDVCDYNSCVAARDAAVEAFGSIDILINFAGGATTRMFNKEGIFYDVPIEIYDYSVDLNLKRVINMDHAVMQQMAKQKSGVIIHLGSITGEEGSESAVAYSATKSALMNGLTKSVAMAGGSINVRCLCIAPGPVLTRANMARMKTLMGRAAEPQEIVDIIMYMTSDKARFATGTTFLMDGGRNILWSKAY